MGAPKLLAVGAPQKMAHELQLCILRWLSLMARQEACGKIRRVWMIGGAGGPGLRRGTIVWCARNTASDTGAAENYSESRRLVFVVGLKLDEWARGDLQ